MKVTLTEAEIDLIQSMMAIAEAGPWSEGDYQEWDEKVEKTFASLQRKLARGGGVKEPMPEVPAVTCNCPGCRWSAGLAKTRAERAERAERRARGEGEEEEIQ